MRNEVWYRFWHGYTLLTEMGFSKELTSNQLTPWLKYVSDLYAVDINDINVAITN